MNGFTFRPLIIAFTVLLGVAAFFLWRSCSAAAAVAHGAAAQPSDSTAETHVPLETSPLATPLPAASPAVLPATQPRFRFSAFRLGGQAEQITPNLAGFLGLTPAEVNELNTALTAAHEAVLAKQIANAGEPRLSSDGGKMTIDVPALGTAESGEIYNRVLSSFLATLGGERFGRFNEVAGGRFENIFDEFGLATVHYDLQAQIRVGTDNAPILDFQRAVRGGALRAVGGSTLDLAGIEKFDPLLFRLLPPEIRSALATK